MKIKFESLLSTVFSETLFAFPSGVLNGVPGNQLQREPQSEFAVSTILTDSLLAVLPRAFNWVLTYQFPRGPPSRIWSKAPQSYLQRSSADPLFSPSEAAAYIGVTEGTLSVWRCNKRYDIPYIKVGRLVKYRKSALDDWLVSRTTHTNNVNEEQP